MFARMRRHTAGRSPRSIALALSLVLAMAAATASAQTYAITSRNDLAMGDGLEWVIIADVNQDAVPDLVTANYNSNDVSVRLATSPGVFGPPTSYPAGGNPYTVAAFDFNNDLFVDLAVANFNGGTVSILQGTGTGAFASKVDYAAGPGCAVAALGEFNGDGIPDLVTANYLGNTVSLLFGNGVGGFQPHVDVATGANPNWVAVCDIDNDGKSDLVTANAGAASVSVLRGNGNGTFQPKVDYAVGNEPLTLTADYLNDDDYIDICTANYSSNSLSVLFGLGGGVLGGRSDMTTPTGPVTVTSGDLNVDGRPDLAVCCDVSNQVSYFLSNGFNFGSRVDFTVGTLPYGVAIGDVTGDGEPDLVSANFASDNVSVLTGDVPGGFRLTKSAALLAAYDQNMVQRLLSSYLGKWVLVDFSAVWCGPCNAMGKDAQRVYNTWVGHPTVSFEYLTYLIDGPTPGKSSTQANATAWATKYALSRPVFHMNGRARTMSLSWFKALAKNAYPTVAIVDPTGTIRYMEAGLLQPQEIVNKVAALAGVAAPSLGSPVVGPPPPSSSLRTIWRPLSGVSVDVKYAASTVNSPLAYEVAEGLTDSVTAVYAGTYSGLPSFPDGFVNVIGQTDSTSATELVAVAAGPPPGTPMPVASPMQLVLKNLTWPDGLPRVIAASSNPKVYCVYESPAGEQAFFLTSIVPAVTLTGSTLTIAPFTLDNVPGLPASTFAVYVNGIMVRHQAQLAVDDGVAAPLALAAAFPNPAETRTLLRWTLPRAQHVDLDVLDAGGRRVRSLRSGATPAGPGTESWDVRDDGGRRVAPGIYFARLRTAGETRTTRLAVIR